MDIDWKYLLTSFEGRINRKPYWIGAGILVGVWLILLFAGWSLFGEAVSGAPVYVLQLLFLYPAAALFVKRLARPQSADLLHRFLAGPCSDPSMASP